MNPNSSASSDKASPLWFFTGFIAVILAGIAKIVIADHFSPGTADESS